MSFDIDPSNFLKNLSEIEIKKTLAIELLAKTTASRLESHAKKTRPWQDKSGNARNSIQGTYSKNGNKVVVALSGNMEYSPYLELANEKKNAVLWPTVEVLTPEIMAELQKVLSEG